MKSSWSMILNVALLAAIGNRSCADDAIDFRRDVQPILAEHCSDCHGPDLRESGLRVDDRANLLQGGDHGKAAIVPGKPNDSFLLQLVRGDDPDLQMPPDADPLPAAQLKILTQWIQEGARFRTSQVTIRRPFLIIGHFSRSGNPTYRVTPMPIRSTPSFSAVWPGRNCSRHLRRIAAPSFDESPST